jgi:hypothetical protein
MNRMHDEAPIIAAEHGDILVHLWGGPLDGAVIATRPSASEVIVDGHIYRYSMILTTEMVRDTFVSEHCQCLA